MRQSIRTGSIVLFVLLVAAAWAPPAVVAAPQAQSDPQEEQERPPRYEEIVVITASRSEQLLLDVPATVAVVRAETIGASPARNYADLLRSTPGLNVSQTSARDISIRPRGATGVVDTGLLVLVDGRTVYQDFFGFVMWDLLPLDLTEIEQIEVIHGPGSAVWGANALSGVVNIRTRTPRSLGDAWRLRAGGGERGTGFGSLLKADEQGPWSYKVGASILTTDPWERPQTLPSGIPGDTFENRGTSQKRVNGRLDRRLGGGTLSFTGGLATTSGIMHTGMGPFSIDDSTRFWYTTAEYGDGTASVRLYGNFVDGDSTNLLNGLQFDVATRTWDLSAQNTTRLADGAHLLTYGGNLRTQGFDLSIAPGEDRRREGGAFLEDRIRLDERLHLTLGARVDGFSVLDDPVLSPRVGLTLRPVAGADHVFRASFGRAYRAPSLLENFADTVIVTPFDLGSVPGSPFAGPFFFPSAALGNEDLVEEQLDQFEVGYRGAVSDGVWLDVAYYRSRRRDVLDFYPAQFYSPADPPPGWPLPPSILALIPLPKTFTFRNIGRIDDQGIEVGLRARLDRSDVYLNYSWQDAPEPGALTINEINIPPAHRFNAGIAGGWRDVFYGASVSFVDEAVWNDVLDARFHGPTEAFTTLDLTVGAVILDGQAEISVRGTNLTDAAFQQHVYGDIIGRRVVAELAVTLD